MCCNAMDGVEEMNGHIGQQLGNYRLIRLLGQGGFADVYLGEHIYLKTPAAIKLLQTRLAKDDLEGFLNEARSIAGLVHSNIVRVLEFGVEGAIPFLVMDYAPNGTLRQRHPKSTRVLPAVSALYIKQVAAALQYAHDRKVIHRDIKPENMLLGRNNEVLLSDFGIAVVAQSSRYQEGGQEIGGTIAYMAPEQLQGRAVPASDQYALGIITYEWLSGDRPFQGSFPEIASQHMLVPPAPLRLKIPGIPKDIEEVVMRALAKDPQQRFMRVEAYANALEHACQAVPPLVIQSGQPSPGTQNTLSDQSRTDLLGVAPQNQFPSGNYGAIPPGQSTPNLSGTPPSSSLTTAMLGTPQGDQPTNTHGNILPGQSSPGFPSMPTYQSQTSPGQNLSPGQFSSTPRDGKNQPANNGVSRRVVVLGLAGLAGVLLLGGGVSLLAHSSQPQNTTSGNSTINTDTATAPADTVTAVPTDTPTTDPNVTPTDTPYPTVQTTPGTVLYTSDWSSGLNGWAGSADWKVLNGVLLNDGTNGNNSPGPTMVPAYQLEGIADYAMEVKVQVTSYQNNNNPFFGFALRGSTVSGNWQGYEIGIGYLDAQNNGGLCNARIITSDFNNPLTSTPYDPGKGLHTYRFEAKGNNLKFFVNGGNILEVTDNLYLTGPQLGIWCYHTELSVTAFRIIAL